MKIAGQTNELPHPVRVLVVDGDPIIVEMLAVGLGYEGIEVYSASTGLAALEQFEARKPDLVLLDLGLPDMDGMEVLRRLRTSSPVPILILSARADVEARIEGLRSGADDYMVKPFDLRELAARIWAILRRQDVRLHRVVRSGELVLYREIRRVTRAGRRIELTPLEFKLLEFFMTHPGRVFTRGELLRHVWGYEAVGAANLVNVHVGNLRRKIGDTHNTLIRTVRGIGYIFETWEDTPDSPDR